MGGLRPAFGGGARRALCAQGRPPYHHSVVEFHYCPQVAEEQEGSQVYAKAGDVPRQFGQGQHLDAVQTAGFVGGNIPPVHSGIDRYLNGTTGSRGMLQQVNRRPPPLIEDVFRRPLAKHDFHNVGLNGRGVWRAVSG